MAPSVAPSDDRMFQLRVALLEIRPPIWRRLQVPGRTRLGELHEVLQIVMGWEDHHLHSFSIGAEDYGPLDPECVVMGMGMEVKNEEKATLAKVAPVKGAVFFYEYDFGDGWVHRVSVEDVLPSPPEKGWARRSPYCLDGARACPPEDCGGIPGYENVLNVLRGRPILEFDREDMLEMYEEYEDYEPEKFDIKAVNKLLEELFR